MVNYNLKVLIHFTVQTFALYIFFTAHFKGIVSVISSDPRAKMTMPDSQQC